MHMIPKDSVSGGVAPSSALPSLLCSYGFVAHPTGSNAYQNLVSKPPDPPRHWATKGQQHFHVKQNENRETTFPGNSGDAKGSRL